MTSRIFFARFNPLPASRRQRTPRGPITLMPRPWPPPLHTVCHDARSGDSDGMVERAGFGRRCRVVDTARLVTSFKILHRGQPWVYLSVVSDGGFRWFQANFRGGALEDTNVVAESVRRIEHHASCIMLLVGALGAYIYLFSHTSHNANVPKQQLAGRVETCSLNPIVRLRCLPFPSPTPWRA